MAKLKTFRNNKNISGNIIKEKIKEKRMLKKDICIKLELMGISITPDELLKIEKNELMIKDFELVALAKILDFDLNKFKEIFND
ncbi:MAG: XRE family transcriptional regulator [Clostridia bacterium]|nr:XRE family transcriptional regulator [Clostridia bacterium]